MWNYNVIFSVCILWRSAPCGPNPIWRRLVTGGRNLTEVRGLFVKTDDLLSVIPPIHDGEALLSHLKDWRQKESKTEGENGWERDGAVFALPCIDFSF